MSGRVVIVDDEQNIRRMLRALLEEEGYAVREASSGEAALSALDDADPDVVLLDVVMGDGMDGLATLDELRRQRRDLSVIMMSGKASLQDAVRAIKSGAMQFLEKPLTPEGVLVAVKTAVDLMRVHAENRALKSALGHDQNLIGQSAVMVEIREMISRVAPTESRVLITGESGTGKELVAAAIHRASPRASAPFVSVNCAAIPRDLVESEMFGHERGAFTGATTRRRGKFELANTGMLFLDEVGDLHADAQAKLLRALETGVIERVGGEREITVDIHVVAATNKNLADAVNAGEFREDLFYRLNVIPLHIPPLRKRTGDIDLLVTQCVARTAARLGRAAVPVTPDAVAELERYPWPGNVRELHNVVERLTILATGPQITATDVQRALGNAEAPAGAPVRALSRLPLNDALDHYERELIGDAIDRASGNIANAARQLQTDRANLYRRMRRLGIERPDKADTSV